MNKIISNALIGAVACLTLSSSAFASSVSYYLDKSNLTSLFPNNTDYLQVTIDDHGVPGDKIYFTVTPLEPLTSIAGSHFGIDKFAFIAPFSGLTFVKSNKDWFSGWSLKTEKNVSIFGKFDALVSGGGNNRSNELTFSVNAGNHTLESYMDALTNGSTSFAAHVSGFSIGCGNGESEDEHENSNSRWSKTSYQYHSSSSTSYEGNEGRCGAYTSAFFGGATLVHPTSVVPVPAAVWLFASGLIGMAGVSRKTKRNIA